ncbi:MAG: lytic transglycosylase domain-containing protein [Desulfovibrio sp.]|nr:lytic transglycosylase domain-containing protein [Desulfovibrio sp.]
MKTDWSHRILVSFLVALGLVSCAKKPVEREVPKDVVKTVTTVALIVDESFVSLLKKNEKASLAQKASSHPVIDDRYGKGALGPRILWHTSETNNVLPTRIHLHPAEATEQESIVASLVHAWRSTQQKPKSARRVFVIREAKQPNTMPHKDQAELSARAYLAQLGITDLYALSPSAHLLRLRSSGRWPRGGGRSRFLSSNKDVEAMIENAAKTYGLDPHLIWAVIRVESNFDPKAVSPVGAQGLMQIMPATQQDLGLKDPFDPKANIMAGAAYFRILLTRYGSPELALAAYNAGMGAVDKYKGIPPYRETQNFVQRVVGFWQQSAEGKNEQKPLLRHHPKKAPKRLQRKHATVMQPKAKKKRH